MIDRDKLDLGLKGQHARAAVADFAVTITTREGFELRIESDFDFTHESLASIDGRTILSARASDDGTLTVDFDNNARLVVRPDLSYEAWTLAGPDGIIAVCTPGGGLTTWSTQPPAD